MDTNRADICKGLKDSLPTCYKTVPHIRDNLKHRLFPSHPFSCVQAPFLDVLGTMEDPSLPLTLEDREEWGDPVRNPQHRLTISSYCPLYNITPQVCRRRKKGKKCRRFFFFFFHALALPKKRCFPYTLLLALMFSFIQFTAYFKSFPFYWMEDAFWHVLFPGISTVTKILLCDYHVV